MTKQTDAAAALGQAYAIEGPALELGSVVVEGAPHPDARVRMPLSMLNRHGLVAGATGTGKTKTLQLIAEQLSAAGVPVFLADIKGDVSGVAAPGTESDRVKQRAEQTATEWKATGFPAEFLSLGGLGTGIPVRATMTSFGPVLLSKVLGLNDTQESSLGLVFHYADENGLALLDLKDLRAVINHLVSDEGKADLKELGGLSTATAGVILRELIGLEDQGGDVFFGEPEFDTADLIRLAPDGRGVMSVMGLTAVQDKPKLFSTFLMWMLADLFHDLPEVGDVDKPKLVFFFDEAHLLFDDASEAFLDAIARTVRLIRSKGVGVFFVTQTPKDVPSEVLAQLGNRVQHALRAFTPDDAKALKATVGTFPQERRVRPDRAAHLDGHRRGGGDDPVRARRPDPGRVDDAAPAELAHGPARPGGHGADGLRVAAGRRVLAGGRPRVGVREAAGQGRRRAGRGRGPVAGRGRAEARVEAPRGRAGEQGRGGPGQQRLPQLRPVRGQRGRSRDQPVAVRHGEAAPPAVGA